VDWLTVAVQWLHVLLGITWFGYAIAMYFFVTPALRALPESEARATNSRLGEIGLRAFPIISALVLILGVLRGTLFGRIQSFEALTTTYGIVFLIALLGTLGLIFTGARYIGPITRDLRDTPDFGASVARLERISRIDLGLFAVVFTCMILMRFL
jgi:uncharacterized membrane protein